MFAKRQMGRGYWARGRGGLVSYREENIELKKKRAESDVEKLERSDIGLFTRVEAGLRDAAPVNWWQIQNNESKGEEKRSIFLKHPIFIIKKPRLQSLLEISGHLRSKNILGYNSRRKCKVFTNSAGPPSSKPLVKA